MRKFILFLLLILFIINLKADEYMIFIGNAYTYNDLFQEMSESQFGIKYDDEKQIFYFYTQDYINKGWIIISEENLIILRNVLNKYLEWEKKAIENKITIEKELPDSNITTKVIWEFGDEWYSSNNLKIKFTFFSQTENIHQLVISSNKTTSSSNEFINFKIDTLYLNKDQIIEFLNGITDEEIKKRIDEIEQKKKIENLFD